MKPLIFFAVVALAVATAHSNDNHYDTKYDNFDVDQLISSVRLMKSYAHCFMGDGKCTPEGNDMKKWIPEASKSGCAKCTPKQKVLVAKFIRALQKQCPEEWEVLNKQADPEGKHQEELEKFLKEYDH